jgi:hypothetical protein
MAPRRAPVCVRRSPLPPSPAAQGRGRTSIPLRHAVACHSEGGAAPGLLLERTLRADRGIYPPNHPVRRASRSRGHAVADAQVSRTPHTARPPSPRRRTVCGCCGEFNAWWESLSRCPATKLSEHTAAFAPLEGGVSAHLSHRADFQTCVQVLVYKHLSVILLNCNCLSFVFRCRIIPTKRFIRSAGRIAHIRLDGNQHPSSASRWRGS